MSTPRTLRVLQALALLLSVVGLGGASGPCFAQDAFQAPSSEVPLIDLISMRVQQFETPIRLGTREGALEYSEALVLEVEVLRKDMDSLPPSMEPFLYIGSREVQIFQVTQGTRKDRLNLRFHLPKWQEIPEGAPMVLTIDHGAPQREPELFLARKDLPRFQLRDTSSASD